MQLYFLHLDVSYVANDTVLEGGGKERLALLVDK